MRLLLQVSLRDVARCLVVFQWFGRDAPNAVSSTSASVLFEIHHQERGREWNVEDFFSVQPKAQAAVRQVSSSFSAVF